MYGVTLLLLRTNVTDKELIEEYLKNNPPKLLPDYKPNSSSNLTYTSIEKNSKLHKMYKEIKK